METSVSNDCGYSFLKTTYQLADNIDHNCEDWNVHEHKQDELESRKALQKRNEGAYETLDGLRDGRHLGDSESLLVVEEGRVRVGDTSCSEFFVLYPDSSRSHRTISRPNCLRA